MSNEIEIFNNPLFGSVRAFADENGEPWFVAADVHKVDSRSVNGVEQAREVSIINESGLYHLVLMS